MEKVYTLSSREDGKWQILKKGNQKPTRVFDVHQEALAYAEELAQKEDIRVIVNEANLEQEIITQDVAENLEVQVAVSSLNGAGVEKTDEPIENSITTQEKEDQPNREDPEVNESVSDEVTSEPEELLAIDVEVAEAPTVDEIDDKTSNVEGTVEPQSEEETLASEETSLVPVKKGNIFKRFFRWLFRIK